MNDIDRYMKAGHAIQTGVKIDHETGSQDGTPKHLRTGINLTKTDHAALVSILISKGILTEAEYFKAVADEAEKEARTYEERLSEKLGRKVSLA